MPRPDSRQLPLFGGEIGNAPAGQGEPSRPTPVEAIEDRSPERPAPPDAAERAHAVDPAEHVVLEASAGTGKTSVLVQRYCNLLTAGVDPGNILAITFTRKAAAEMRERIVRELRRDALRSAAGRRRWLELRDRVGDIAISTIDAFCLSLLREFPLEADLDPSFRVADDTEVARLMERRARSRVARRAGRSRRGRHGGAGAHRDEHAAIACGAEAPARPAVGRPCRRSRGFLARAGAPASAVGASWSAAIERLRAALAAVAGRRRGLPRHGAGRLVALPAAAPRPRRRAARARLVDGAVRRRVLEHLAEYFLTQKGEPRTKLPAAAPAVRGRGVLPAAQGGVRRARGTGGRPARPSSTGTSTPCSREACSGWPSSRSTRTGVRSTTRTCSTSPRRSSARSAARADGRVLAEPLPPRVSLPPRPGRRVPGHEPAAVAPRLPAGRGVALGRRARCATPRSRPRCSSSATASSPSTASATPRWRSSTKPSQHIAALRPGTRPHRAITTSFRSAPALLAFVNDLFDAIDKAPGRSDGFRYDDRDRFPVPDRRLDGRADDRPAARHRRGADAGRTPRPGSRTRFVRLIASETHVRDRETGRQAARPGRRHRHPVPLARLPSRLRGRARGARRAHLRLQGTRLLRVRRDPGPLRADSLPRAARLRRAGSGVSAIAVRPPQRRRPRRRSHATSGTCCAAATSGRRSASLGPDDRRRARPRAVGAAPVAGAGPTVFRRRTSWTPSSATRPTRSRCGDRATRRRART